MSQLGEHHGSLVASFPRLMLEKYGVDGVAHCCHVQMYPMGPHAMTRARRASPGADPRSYLHHRAVIELEEPRGVVVHVQHVDTHCRVAEQHGLAAVRGSERQGVAGSLQGLWHTLVMGVWRAWVWCPDATFSVGDEACTA